MATIQFRQPAFYPKQGKCLPEHPYDNPLKKVIVVVLLNSLPEVYKAEALAVFHETCKSYDIKEAFAYFEGGMVYRLHSLRNQLLRKIT